MLAFIALFFPAAIMVVWKRRLFKEDYDWKAMLIEYIAGVVLINFLVIAIAYLFFGSKGSVVGNINAYINYSIKYILLAMVLALGMPWAAKRIREFSNNKYPYLKAIKESVDKDIEDDVHNTDTFSLEHKDTAKVSFRSEILQNLSLKSDNYRLAIYIIVGAISALIFCLIYGVHVLNPTYVDWLLSGGDLTQHYLGWVAYRKSSWYFPIGMTNNLAYPNMTSVIFTDSIPCFAVIFKVLSPFLPENFQYFGWWGILCFILQGVLAARIIRQFTENKAAIIISSCLFAFTPVMIRRMYGHTSLAGQWILLFALYPIFCHNKYKTSKALLRYAILLGLFSSLTHIYYVAFCGIILLGFCLYDLMKAKSVKRIICVLFAYIFSAAACIALLGGFSSGANSEAGGLGTYSFNLNALFNPQSWSSLFPDLPLYGTGQYEGFAYLGAGCIVIIIIALFVFFMKKSKEDILRIFIKYRKLLLSLALIVILSVVVAMSPTVTFGNKVLFSIAYPDFIVGILNAFRSTGRFIWIAIYVLMLCGCILLCKTTERKTLVIVLTLALALQVFDLNDVLISKNNKFNQIVTYESPLSDDDFWIAVGENEDIQHIVYVDSFSNDIKYGFTDWALRYGKTVSSFYFARSIASTSETAIDALNDLPEDTVFVFAIDESGLEQFQYGFDLYYYEVNGLIIASSYPVEGYTPIDTAFLTNIWTFGENKYLSSGGGEDTEDGRILYSGGRSYGPYWLVPTGDYIITISGEDLSQETDITIYSDSGAVSYEYEILQISEEEIVIEISLEELIDDLEISIINESEEDILLHQIEMTKK